MWKVKVKMVPVVICALYCYNTQTGTTSEISVQKSTVLGTAKISCRLQVEDPCGDVFFFIGILCLTCALN